jgi:integrase
MASIYKRGTVWWGRCRKGGKEFRKSLETDSKHVASKRLTEWIAAIEDAKWGGKEYTFDEMMEHFLLNYIHMLKPTSAKRYIISARMLTPYFEGLKLSDINTERLTHFMKSRHVSGATVLRDLACLSSALEEFSVYKEIDLPNPVKSFIKRQKRKGILKESAPRTRYLSHEEECKLTGYIPAYMLPAYQVAIDTGLRSQELLSLKWEQVDLVRKEIFIPEDKAKSAKARKVPLLDRAGTILGTLPRHIKSDYVFTNSKGERYLRFTKGWNAAVRRSGLENLWWHDLRRTCGCRLLQDYSMPIERVSKWLGHATIAQTQRAYAFLEVDQLHESVRTKTGTGHMDKFDGK